MAIKTKNVMLLVLLLDANSLFSQQSKCELFRLLSHNVYDRLTMLKSEKVSVALEKGKFFDFELSDSSVFYSSTEKEVKVRPKDDLSYSIKIKGKDVFLLSLKDTINLNQDHDSASNIIVSDEFVSSRKIGKSSFLDIVYVKGKTTKIEILELNRTVSIWVSYSDNKPEINKIKIDWLDTENYLLLVYSIGSYPYLFDYYDSFKKGGVAVFFAFRKNYISSALLYELSQGGVNASESRQLDNFSTPPKGASKIIGIKYDKSGIINKKSKNMIGCK